MTQNPATVAEAYLAALARGGVDYLFANAGTDFAPLIEAIAASDETGLRTPRAVEVVHETVAVAMAHGYYLATGRPQAVMVHVNVGMANAVMGLINAFKAQVPVLFSSGRTPITEHGRLGSRDVPIHWGQEMFDQGAMIREVVKWDTELRSGDHVVDLVDRARAVALSEPRGPVYLSLPREVLAGPLPRGFEMPPEQPAPTPPHPDPDAVRTAASMIADAEHPLVLGSLGGEAVFDAATALAERHALPVCEYWRVSPIVSTDHPFFAGEAPAEDLARADVVVVVNAMVPWMPSKMTLREGARVIHIGPDPHFADVPVRTFPAELAITSDTAAGLRALCAALDEVGHGDSDRVRERRARLVPELATRRAATFAAAGDAGGAPMSPAFMSRIVGETVGDDATIVNELGLATPYLAMTRWDSYFGLPIAGGLGWAGGAALGVQLADPSRRVVWATGDGSYVFSNPAAVHHVAASLGLGLLTVVADNRVWNAVRRAAIGMYPEGRAAQATRDPDSSPMPLTSLEPAPDYARIVEAYGGHGETVTDPGRLRGALDTALEVTATGRQALVAVRCGYRDAAQH